MRSSGPKTRGDAAGLAPQPLMLLRVDASESLGAGHAMRCLALAQAWSDRGGGAVFAMAETMPGIESRIRAEGCGLVRLPVVPASQEDAASTARTAAQVDAAWIVLDGYRFGPGYQRQIREAGHPLLTIDDGGCAGACEGDMILDQNLGAREATYAGRKSTARLLLGPRYAMLRREFVSWQQWRRAIPPVAKTVLVTFGGGDVAEVTLQAVRALAAQDGPREATVVVGGSPAVRERIERAVDEAGLAIRVEHETLDMPGLMAWADLGLTAAGSTVWEAAFMGLPSLLAVRAPNQRPVAEALDREGVASVLGPADALSMFAVAESLSTLARDAGRRAEMARRGRELVDGDGAARVVMALRGDPVRLRRVREDDRRLLWEWANDPDVRAVSFTPESIGWDSHVRWFEARLRDPRCEFYIGVDQDDKPVGQIRFDHEDGEAIVSVSIARSSRGRGYGTRLIEIASHKVAAATGATIRAYVKAGNEASRRSFQRAGYRQAGVTTIRDQDALAYVFSRKRDAERSGCA